MPELPEVETVKNSLKDLVIGKKIINVKVFYNRIIQNVSIDDFEKKLIGETFQRMERVGKYLIFILDHYSLVAHLRMEGKYFLRQDEPKEKHEHVIFYLENNETLRYNDTRKFGVIFMFPYTNVEDLKKLEPLCRLGIEPISGMLTEDYLLNIFKKINKPLKTVLLDQEIISGLGNIYADEVCFMAGLSPKENVHFLDIEDVKKICESSKKVLEKAIELGGTTIRSFVSSHAATGRFQNELLVHTKEFCPTCQSKIEKIYIGGRGTYFCPNCQKTRRIKIGITGGISSGKSTVCEYLKNKGYIVFDCDKISHDLLDDQKVCEKVVSVFSQDVLTDNKIDRKKLGNIVFNDNDEKKKLENIIHPIVIKKCKQLLDENNICFIEVPLLYETHMENLFDEIIVVYSTKEKQLERLISRNNLSEPEAKKRIECQIPLEEKKMKTDYLINTDKDLETTYNEIDNLLKKVL